MICYCLSTIYEDLQLRQVQARHHPETFLGCASRKFVAEGF